MSGCGGARLLNLKRILSVVEQGGGGGEGGRGRVLVGGGKGVDGT